MTLAIAEDPVGEDLTDLKDHLSATRPVRPYVRYRRSVIPAGHMGTSDVLGFVADPAVLSVIAGSIGVWLKSRSRPTRLRVRHGDTEVEVESRHLKEPEQLLVYILQVLATGQDDGVRHP